MDASLAALITGCFGLLSILLTYMLTQQHKTNKHVQEVKYQVKNSHETNLREDIDRIDRNLHLLVTVEREAREALADRLDAHLAMHEGM